MALTNITQRELRFFPLPVHSTEQPVRNTDKPACSVPEPTLFRMFNRMRQDPALLIELEDEEPTELLIIPDVSTKPLSDFVDLLVRPNPSIEGSHALAPRLAAGSPSDNEPFIVGCLVRYMRPFPVLDDALGEDLESDIAENRYTSPGHGRGPERCMVRDAAACGWEMRVGRRKEV